VVVAVPAVRVVQVAVDDVVGVIAVRDRFMAAAGAVRVILPVITTRMGRRAVRRVRATHGELVLVDVVAMRMVQVPVVEVVGVPVVLDLRVAAVRAVLMIVVLVFRVIVAHRRVPFAWLAQPLQSSV
jgi:hypothetical protein